ncbi:MAG: N-formylglutamate amidohydrolase [Planktomarina sp.]
MTDHTPFFVTGDQRSSRWVITADHARNTVPDFVGGDLGLPAADMTRHIAFDPGAEGVALALGELLDAPVICANFSRLVIDPNRGSDDPTLVMQLYDGTIIPANRGISEAAIKERADRLYHPYHNALQGLMDAREAPILIAIHSFTPQLKGRAPRPWKVGVLFAKDTRLSDPFIAELQKNTSLTVGINEPYVGHLPGDSVDTHALKDGHHNTLIELRNDLIETEAQQAEWAALLAPVLITALDKAKD